MIMYKIIRPILYLFIKIKYNPKVINKENIPKKNKCILAGNHTNNYDFMLLGMSTRRCIRYVAKDELFKGIKKYLFKSLGLIPVNRKIHDKTVIPTCVNLLNQNNIIGIFPEGTINKTNQPIIPFKKGAVVMSTRSNAPIIPFAINGNYTKNKLKIIYGKPYFPSEDIDKEIIILENKVKELLKKAECINE